MFQNFQSFVIWFTQILADLILHILHCFAEVFGTFFLMPCFHIHFAFILCMYIEKYKQDNGFIQLIFLVCFGSSSSLPV